MLRQSILFLLTALAATLIGALPAGADPLYPTGLRVGLTPPPGMAPSTHFTGFEDASRKTAIKILDLPAAAYQNLEKSIFAAVRKGSGVTIEKREAFPFNDGLGFLVTFDQQKEGVTLHRWVMVAQSSSPSVPNLSTLIDVEVPAAASSVYTDDAIRAALRSVTFRPTPIDEQLRAMPFKLDVLAGFRVLRVLRSGAVFLTDGPSGDVSRQPYMIVAVGSGAPANAGDRGEFSRELLMTAPLVDLVITSIETIRVNNVPTIEIRARAKGPHGDPLSVIQWTRFGSSAFLRVAGVAHKEDWDRLFPRFRAVRDGITQRER